MKRHTITLLIARITLSAFQTQKEPEGKNFVKHIVRVAAVLTATKVFLEQVNLFKASWTMQQLLTQFKTVDA